MQETESITIFHSSLVQKPGPPLSALNNRYLFQGREYSWATHAAWGGAGLYYFRARWYDPQTGRWLSNDPIGISGGLNQYAFCASNPVMFVDPEGLSQNVLSMGGKEIYYPRGGWSTVNVATTTYEQRSTSVLSEAAKGTVPVMAVFAASAISYFAYPYVLAGGTYLYIHGQNVYNRLMTWKPMSFFDGLIHYDPLPRPPQATLVEVITVLTPTSTGGPSYIRVVQEIATGSPHAIFQQSPTRTPSDSSLAPCK